MAKKWLDSIEKQRRRIDLKERYKHTDIQTYRQTESTTKNSRLLAGAESIHVWYVSGTYLKPSVLSGMFLTTVVT